MAPPMLPLARSGKASASLEYSATSIPPAASRNCWKVVEALTPMVLPLSSPSVVIGAGSLAHDDLGGHVGCTGAAKASLRDGAGSVAIELMATS